MALQQIRRISRPSCRYGHALFHCRFASPPLPLHERRETSVPHAAIGTGSVRMPWRRRRGFASSGDSVTQMPHAISMSALLYLNQRTLVMRAGLSGLCQEPTYGAREIVRGCRFPHSTRQDLPHPEIA